MSKSDIVGALTQEHIKALSEAYHHTNKDFIKELIRANGFPADYNDYFTKGFVHFLTEAPHEIHRLTLEWFKGWFTYLWTGGDDHRGDFREAFYFKVFWRETEEDDMRETEVDLSGMLGINIMGGLLRNDMNKRIVCRYVEERTLETSDNANYKKFYEGDLVYNQEKGLFICFLQGKQPLWKRLIYSEGFGYLTGSGQLNMEQRGYSSYGWSLGFGKTEYWGNYFGGTCKDLGRNKDKMQPLPGRPQRPLESKAGFIISAAGDESTGIFPATWDLSGEFYFESQEDLEIFEAKIKEAFEYVVDDAVGVSMAEEITDVDFEEDEQNDKEQ